MFFTYILYSEKYNKYYTGHCQNLEKRLKRHNSKLVASTQRFIPWLIVYYEIYATKLEANRRELEIKKMKSRLYIEALISKNRDKV
jgi:putative endonuclease